MKSLSDDIWIISGFLDAVECRDLITRAEAIGFEAATISTKTGQERDETVRNNDRVIIDDADLATTLWSKLREHVPPFLGGRQTRGLNERFRFYRYGTNQRFRGHIDNPYTRTNGETSLLTFMVYLNDGYEGGETSFPTLTVKPQTGAALIFRHDIFHEGRPIHSGTKYVLRSDVMFNPIGRISG